jgi:gliding motility-associated-like protein
MNRHWLLVLLVSLFFTKTFGQNISNEGTDFWAVFPTHVPSNGANGNIAIFVTSKSISEVTVSCGSAAPVTKTIPANTAVRFDVPRANAYIDRVADANKVLANKGIHIKVSDGKPKVSVYAHIYGRARSAASLILPFETLGQTYYSMNFTQTNGGNNFLTLVGVEDNTNIILHEKNGNKIPITLKAGDAYEYLALGTEDLTGVYVETDPATSSCKRFAAFSGTSAVAIVCNSSQDPLFQQLYPTNSWGKNYGVVPFIDRKYILRILAQEDNTSVTYNGITQIIDKGKFIETEALSISTFITANKLISVAEYALSQDCSSINGRPIMGDPEMVILNPIEFNIKGVTVFSSNLESIEEKYINVLIRTDKTSGFRYNGVAPTTVWTTLIGNPLYSYTQIPVNSESVTLTAADGFNAIAYGFGDHESYAYSAGTNLSSNNYLTVYNTIRNEEGQNGCVGENYNIKITLPYKPNQISWSLDNEAVILQNAPLLLETKNLPDGTSIYTYDSPYSKTYTTKGKHNLDVIAYLPNGSACISGETPINYTFDIYDLPTSKFDPLIGCAGSDVKFTDKSVPNSDLTITKWLWDFGDGTSPSTDQHPVHTYTKAGEYFARLTVSTEYNCSSTSDLVKIIINPTPVADFNVAGFCTNKPTILTDKSTIENPGKIVKWTWDFGDGTPPVTFDNDVIPPHQYSIVGSYIITLTVESDNHCSNTKTSEKIEIFDPLKDVDFTLPDFCLDDGVAKFKNTSKNPDGTTTGLTAKWTYSFNNVVVASSSGFDGSFSPTEVGDYTVTLIVESQSGCESSVPKTFTVNGAVEKAEIEVVRNNVCVNDKIIIKNRSNTFAGKITKIEIYRDYPKDKTIYKTIPYPGNSDIEIQYDTFGGTLDREATIRLVAYSGESCFKIDEKPVILKPIPQLEFGDMPSVCEADGTVQITQARQKAEEEVTGGEGEYAGDGTKSDGTFNPKIAGVGEHTITYTYRGDNGCSNSISKNIIVNQSPIADAGNSIYILSGGQIELPATAEGKNLKYEWSPATGLNKTNVLNPVASPDQDTEYTLTATTQPDGCATTSKILVKVLQALNPPNTFTPNGDNVNDTWTIKYLESYPNATVEIFNRNGLKVFSSKGYKVPFDGTYQNEPLPVGVYYYIIAPQNGRKTITGPLTIIR